MLLSSISSEGLTVQISTEHAPSCRGAFSGRATLSAYTGVMRLQCYPTVAELRKLAAELSEAADKIEAEVE